MAIDAEKLKTAIWQANRRGLNPDLAILIEAAEAHLDTLPKPRKVKVTGKIKYKNGDFVVWDLNGVPVADWRNGTEIEFHTEYETTEPA
jgi:hypothetical protein